MAIRKKSKEELQAQAEGFLNYASERGKITEKQKKKISKTLGISEPEEKGFFERLSKKFGKEIDISDELEIKKVLKKKKIDVEKLWDDYLKYLHEKSVDKHNSKIRKKVEEFFEPYKTPDDGVNKKIIITIANNYSKDIIKKFNIFLTSEFYKDIFIEGKNIHGSLTWMNDKINREIENVLKFFVIDGDEGDLGSLLGMQSFDLLECRVNGSFNSINFDLFKKNISILNKYGYEKGKYKPDVLWYCDFEPYIQILENQDIEGFRRDFDQKEENEELKNIFLKFKDLGKDDLLKYCIKCGLDEIDKVLDKRPNIRYENNGGYTSRLVHMFGGDWDNNEMMRKYLGGWNFDFLAYLWTVYRTKNWKKNIDLVYNEGLISTSNIKSFEEYMHSSDGPTNMYIAHLKVIDNEILESLIKKGVSKEDFEKFLRNTDSINYKNLEILLKKYPDITIKDLNLLEGVLNSRESGNLKIIFKKYPKIKIKELTLLNSAKSEILNIIFEKYPEIKVEELTLLENENTHIISSAKSKILSIIFEKYPEIKVEELTLLENENTHIISLAELENLNMILKKYPEITIKELVLFDDVLKWTRVLFMELLNFETLTLSERSLSVLDLFGDYTKNHNEIFENIENKEEINDRNWIDITGLYSAIEYFEDDKTISDEIKTKIRELLQDDNNKDFICKKLTELLKKSLSVDNELINEEIALLAVLNKKGLFNMGQSESLAKFVYQINKLDKNYKFNKTFTEIKGDIKKFINSHKNDSNELMNSFYQVSTSLLERSPSIYRNLIKLLNKLDSKQQEMFYKDIFSLYNVELFLGEGEGKYTLLGTKVNNDVRGQLIPMHERIKILLDKVDSNDKNDINNLLDNEKETLVTNIKHLFKEKFGIKKIPSEFTNENIESIKWHSIYLSNMHNRDDEKECILGYFLALKLDGKRKEFREGKCFDPSEYMDDSKVRILTDYLSKRSERDSVYKLDYMNENDKQILQENESNTIIGNTNGITDRLKTIESNVNTLLDDDIYSERQKIIKKYLGKNLGKLLAKQFQILSGKNITLTDEEKQTLLNVSQELGDDLSNVKNVQNLQSECKPISAIVNFVNKIINENLPKEIKDFDMICKPSNEHLELLKKIGINLDDGLIISSNSYLTYVESGIRKWKNKLTDDEYNSLSEYIGKVKTELDDLYGIKDKLTILYGDFKNKIIDKYFENTEIKQRFDSMSPYFFTKADVEKENIVSLMTNDLDIVIKNIRQCLGCKDKGCNNDTDLSFGCDDRFFITTSHREGDTSFADELVTLLPRSPKEEGFTFVMDCIYGNNGSTDILLNNIYVILKKINKLSPELRKKISIFVPNGIAITLNEDGIEKIKKQYNGINIDQQEITVTVESQPITDSYHEFGGISPRSTGDAKISGYLIKFE